MIFLLRLTSTLIKFTTRHENHTFLLLISPWCNQYTIIYETYNTAWKFISPEYAIQKKSNNKKENSHILSDFNTLAYISKNPKGYRQIIRQAVATPTRLQMFNVHPHSIMKHTFTLGKNCHHHQRSYIYIYTHTHTHTRTRSRTNFIQ